MIVFLLVVAVVTTSYVSPDSSAAHGDQQRVLNAKASPITPTEALPLPYLTQIINPPDEVEEEASDEVSIPAPIEVTPTPSRWELPDEVWIHIPRQNRVKLSANQMSNLAEIYEFFTEEGLAPHLIAAIAGNIGQEDSLRNVRCNANGYFGHFQLDHHLYDAFLDWNNENGAHVGHPSTRRQCIFFWDVMNGWGERKWFPRGHYRQTLIDFLEAETVEDAAIILNAGKDGNPRDGVDGFFRGNMSHRTTWARQIYDQLVEVHP